MDEKERLALEREVREHLARVEVLGETLRELEENLLHVVNPPKELIEQVRSLRGDIRGRMAAIAIGEARLGVDPF